MSDGERLTPSNSWAMTSVMVRNGASLQCERVSEDWHAVEVLSSCALRSMQVYSQGGIREGIPATNMPQKEYLFLAISVASGGQAVLISHRLSSDDLKGNGTHVDLYKCVPITLMGAWQIPWRLNHRTIQYDSQFTVISPDEALKHTCCLQNSLFYTVTSPVEALKHACCLLNSLFHAVQARHESLDYRASQSSPSSLSEASWCSCRAALLDRSLKAL